VCVNVFCSGGDERADEVQVRVISIPEMECAVIGGWVLEPGVSVTELLASWFRDDVTFWK